MPRLTNLCPICNKLAEEKSFTILPSPVNLKVINLKCGHAYTEKIEPLKDWQKVETYPEFGKKLKLFPYQGEGYEFARQSGFRAIIGDEPGLGKTFQALVCIRLHPEELTPTLIICKSALKLQQMRAAIQMLGPDFLPEIIADSSQRPSGLFKITIATYDILWRIQKRITDDYDKKCNEIRAKLKIDEFAPIPEQYENQLPSLQNPFATYGFKYCILDECQQIKNPNSKRAAQVRDICRVVPHVIATSGSPIENHAGEYYTILNIMRPERFPSYKQFVETFCEYYETAYGAKVGGIASVEFFKEQTKDFIIRRRMDDVQKDLPKLFRKFISCEFASDKLKREQQQLMEEFAEYFYENEGSNNFSEGILARIAKMRHLAGINKIPFAVEYVVDFLNDTGKKIVIFTHHQDVNSAMNFKLISAFTDMRRDGVEIDNPTLYLASMDSKQRDAAVQEFINNPKARVFLASTLAAGEGLDGLQKVCQDVVLLERQWNPKKEEQAEKRVQRIGSLGTKMDITDDKGNIIGSLDGRIDAHYILSAGTIDEYFTELVEIKRANTDQTLDGTDFDWNESSLMKELAQVLATKGSKKWRLK